MNAKSAVLSVPRKCSSCGAELNAENHKLDFEICRIPSLNSSNHRDLTTRERQVVGLIRLGMLNKEIAGELKLTEGTVKEYLNRIFRKLDVKNRTELAVWALMHQIAG